MAHKFSEDELNMLDKKLVISMFLSMQDQLERMNENMEALIEQIRLANQKQFGRSTEKLDQISGQLSLFNEAEYFSDENVEEPDPEETLPPKNSSRKKKGKREEDLKGFPEEHIPHTVTDEEADAHFGKGCWRRLEPDKYPKDSKDLLITCIRRNTMEKYRG